MGRKQYIKETGHYAIAAQPSSCQLKNAAINLMILWLSDRWNALQCLELCFKSKALTKYKNKINIDRLILNLVLKKYTSIDFMKIFSTPFICLQNKI